MTEEQLLTQTPCRDTPSQLVKHVVAVISAAAEQLLEWHAAGILGGWGHARDVQPQPVHEPGGTA